MIEIKSFGECVETLRSNGYAPVPIHVGHSRPSGPYAVHQLNYGDAYADAVPAVLTACPAAHDAGSPVQNARETHLVVVSITPRPVLDEGLDALMIEHGGLVVRVKENGERDYIFASTGGPPGFVDLSEGDWPRGSLLDHRRDELTYLDAEGVEEIKRALSKWDNEHPEPYVPPPKYVAPPILAPGQKIMFDNSRARGALKRAGFDVVQTKGGGVGFSMSPRGDLYENRLITVAIESRSAELADVMLAKFGVKDRTGGILPKLGELIRKRGEVPCRRESNGSLLFLFQNSNSATFEPIVRMFSAQGANGKDIPGTSVRVRVMSRGVVELTGDNVPAWDADFLKIKRDELPELSEFSTKNYLLEEFAAFMAAGGGLDAAPVDAGAKGKGARKSSAATA